jgi:hypothetical protein
MTYSKTKLRIIDYKISHATSALQIVSNFHKNKTVKPYRSENSGH